jgi:hypothetical protein
LGTQRPVLPPEITERFESRRANLPAGAKVLYKPALLGQAKLHYTQTTSGVDAWQDAALLLPVSGPLPAELWATAGEELESPPELENQPEAGAVFAELPGELSRAKRYAELATALKDHLYRNRKLSVWKCSALKQTSRPGETEAEFRVRLGQLAREQRDAQVEKLRQKYAPKLESLQERRRKAVAKVDKEKAQANQQTMSAAMSFGSSILGMLLGRKFASTANVTRATTAARAGSRAWQQRGDIGEAEDNVEAVEAKIAALENEFQAEMTKVQDGLQPGALVLEDLQIAPKKSEINVSGVTLVWQPTIQ